MRRKSFLVLAASLCLLSAGMASAQVPSSIYVTGDFDGDGKADKAEFSTTAEPPTITVDLGSGGRVTLSDISMTAGDLFEVRHGGTFRPPPVRRTQPPTITVITDVIVQGWKTGPKLVWYFRDGGFHALRQN